MKNKNLQKWMTGAAFGLFVIGLFVWTSSLTLGVVGRVLPHAPVVKYFALALFDGGAAVWLLVYIYKAKGTPQRGAAILMTVADLAGVAAMSYGEIMLGGQDLTAIPTGLGTFVIRVIIIATVLNLVSAYYFHANDPDTREQIQNQEIEDELTEEAMTQARANIEREARQLGAILARRATARLKYRLALPMSEQEAEEFNGHVIEAQAEDMPGLPSPARHTFWDMLKSFFTGRQSRESSVMPQSKNSTDLPNQPEPEPVPAPSPDGEN
jgi:hypothetical protein